MISEFEAKLADVLGARLPAPFTGRVDVAPGPAGSPVGGGPRFVLGAVRAEALDPDLGSRRPEQAPGVDDPRRVLRLRCTVAIGVRVGAPDDRGERQRAVDAALYLLDAPDLRDGSALLDDGDPGFVVHKLRAVDAASPLRTEDGPAVIMATAEGWFWPVGVAGQAGEPIEELRARQAVLPLTVRLTPTRTRADGDPVAVEMVLSGATGRLIEASGSSGLSFGRLAVFVEGPGGKPGAGVLQGGDDGPGGARLIFPVDGVATLTYQPPATAARDTLVVTMEHPETGRGVELGRTVVEVVG